MDRGSKKTIKPIRFLLIFLGSLVITVLAAVCGVSVEEIQETEGSAASAASVVTGSDTQGSAVRTDGRQAEREEAASYFHNLAEGIVPVHSVDEETHTQIMVLDLGSVQTVGYFRILWDSRVVQLYQLDGSEDGENYMSLFTSSHAPYLNEDLIELPEAASARWVRFSVTSSETFPTPEIYQANPWEAVETAIQPSYISYKESENNNSVVGRIVTSGVPEGISASFGGCDLEQVVFSPGDENDNGTNLDEVYVRSVLQEKTVQIGYRLTYDNWSVDSRDYELTIPCEDEENSKNSIAEDMVSEAPAVIPTLQEWKGAAGTISLRDQIRVVYDGGDEAASTATLLQKDLQELSGFTVKLVSSYSGDQKEPADIALALDSSNPDNAGLGKEGYRMRLGMEDDYPVRISAADPAGLYWGTRTLLQMVKLGRNPSSSEGDASSAEEDPAGTSETDPSETVISLPCGQIRDYPTSPVRGVTLDVGRNTMSLHTIRQIAEQMSWYKLNELTLHLNDNMLMTYSNRADSVADAMSAYSAYRMESEIQGTEGKSITASDLSYSKEDFAVLVNDLEMWCIKVIPEIDTPAHSLAFTSAFPSLALTGRPTSVEMLDCSNDESVQLAERIWDEQLDTAFRNCDTISIGGDEYYSSADDYVAFMNSLIDHLGVTKSPERTIRMWGSQSRLQGTDSVRTFSGASQNPVELCLWSTAWADPVLMYRSGYQLINARSDLFYIICGEAADYLDTEKIYNEWHLNRYDIDVNSPNFGTNYFA